MFRSGLFNFSKGELAPALHGRVDVAAYNAALRKAENVVILKYGGITRRMGTRVAYELTAPAGGWDVPEAAARLIPFEFSIEQSYALLFTHAAMRPLALGGAVLEEELAIEGVTNAAQAVVTVSNHGYAVGDEWFPTGVAGALGEFLNGRVWKIVAVGDADHFTINANTVGLAAFSGATGGVVRPDPPPPPPPPPPVPPPYIPPDPPEVYNPGGGKWREREYMSSL